VSGAASGNRTRVRSLEGSHSTIKLPPFGGGRGIQTPDPLLAKQTLYQLSYTPELEVRVGFEPTVVLLCRQLPWTTRPPHYDWLQRLGSNQR
jgi:hypothetical protein